MSETASPGVRFARLSENMKPHLLPDVWFMVDSFSFEDCLKDSGPYAEFWQSIDIALGRSTRFVFIGELDPREDLSEQHRLADVLLEIGVDVTRPLAASQKLGVSLHSEARWPGYYLLVRGTAAERQQGGMFAYLFRLSA
jgi:hypothetical protein